MLKWLVLVGTGVATLLTLSVACSSGDDATIGTGEGLSRVSEAGGVTVEATWLTSGDPGSVDADLGLYSPDEFALIELKLTAHSGDLNEIDMVTEASLSQDGGSMLPEAWVSTSDNSHHRAGILVFPAPIENGPVSLAVDLGDETVSLRWEAAPAPLVSG